MPTPEEEAAAKKAADEAAKKTQDDDITKRKNKLKQDADDTEGLAKKLASQVSPAGGVTLDEFEKWIPGFETGFISKTPETSDTPYGEPYGVRPKVKILDKGIATPSPSPSPSPSP